MPNTLIFRECKKLFAKIPPADAHDLIIKILKNRGNSQLLKEFVEKAPASLSAYAMTISSDKKKMQSLMAWFENSIQAVLAT